MKTIVTRTATAITFSLLVCGQTLAAEPKQKTQSNNAIVGLGSGVLVGTAIAGPIGGMLGGLFGILIADDVNDEIKLKDSKALVQKKQQQLVAWQQRYQEADARANILMATMDKKLEQKLPELESSIQFKTASAQLEPHYKTELDLLAATLRANPQLQIKLSGYADQRGDSDYNQNLSELRAHAVQQYLLDQGVQATQMLTQSFGESSLVSTGNQLEDNFFDRRVSIKVSEYSEAMTAANP